jgi:hypothetical protein
MVAAAADAFDDELDEEKAARLAREAAAAAAAAEAAAAAAAVEAAAAAAAARAAALVPLPVAPGVMPRLFVIDNKSGAGYEVLHPELVKNCIAAAATGAGGRAAQLLLSTAGQEHGTASTESGSFINAHLPYIMLTTVFVHPHANCLLQQHLPSASCKMSAAGTISRLCAMRRSRAHLVTGWSPPTTTEAHSFSHCSCRTQPSLCHSCLGAPTA